LVQSREFKFPVHFIEDIRSHLVDQLPLHRLSPASKTTEKKRP
jgi:hypothetical protein